jgi:hypothetical protein
MVTRDGKRPLAALIVALLLTVGVTACGGSDSGDSTAASTSGSATAPSGDEGGNPSAQEPAKDKAEKRGEEQDGSQGEGGNSPPENVATPLKVSGGGSEQFRTKGGDNSIQEYGEEDESELQEVAEIVHGFFVARAEERWEAACSYLAKANVEQLHEIASQSPEFKQASCGRILEAFTRSLAPSVDREVTTVDAGSFRHDGDQGFLIYYGAEHTAYAVGLHQEDGTWKVTTLSGTPLR